CASHLPNATCANGYTRVRTWNFTDACGNTSASFVQTITVQDTTAPVAPAAPADAGYQCVAQVPPAGSLTAHDACSGDITVTGVDSDNGGAGCPGHPLIITRTWTFNDGCGNSSSAYQTITVIDDTAPTVTTAATSLDRTVECSDAAGLAAALALAPAATDNCTTPTIHLVSDVPTPNATCANGYTRVRTWNFTDACGNTSASFVQTITVQDTTAPVAPAAPADA